MAPVKREIATDDEIPCFELLAEIMVKKMPTEMTLEAKTIFYEVGRSYWRQSQRKSFWRLWEWGDDFKAFLVRNYKRFNANKVPVYYIDDEGETFLKISKVVDYFKRSVNDSKPDDKLEADAILGVKNWISKSSQYPQDMSFLLQEFHSIDMAIDQLQGSVRKRISQYPHIEEIIIIKDGKKVVEIKEFFNRESLLQYKDELRVAKKSLMGRGLFINGKIDKREMLQAKNFRRLIFLLDKLRDIQLTNDKNGRNNSEELLSIVESIQSVLLDKTLAPSKRYRSLLVNAELSSEFKDLFRTIEDQKVIREGKKFYQSMTPEQLKLLGIKDMHGRSGELVKLFKKNKWTALVLGVSSAGGVTGVTISIKDFLMSDAQRRLQCVEKPDDKAFMACFKDYLRNKYKVKNPFYYTFYGNSGLLEALKGDERMANEFKEEYRIVIEMRAHFKKIEVDSIRFEQELLQKIEDLVKEDIKKEDIRNKKFEN